MNLQLPEITSKHYARQVLDAMHEEGIFHINFNSVNPHPITMEEVLAILFPEGE